jgi:hypothetical protein
VLTSFRDSVSFSSVNSISKEFIPRNSRSCNALAWNPVYHNELAAGLGKVRCDFSTLVWDVNQSSGTSLARFLCACAAVCVCVCGGACAVVRVRVRVRWLTKVCAHERQARAQLRVCRGHLRRARSMRHHNLCTPSTAFPLWLCSITKSPLTRTHAHAQPHTHTHTHDTRL